MLAYDYLVKIEGWTGISRLAARDMIFDSEPYTGLLLEPTQKMIRSSDSGARSPATVVVSNNLIPMFGKFSDSFISDDIRGKQITILEVERGSITARTVYKGIVLYFQFNELTATLTCAEESLSLSKRIDKPLDSEDFPRAREEDVGKSIPVPFGLPVDCVLPMVEYSKPTRLESDIDETATEIVVDDLLDFTAGDFIFIGEELVEIDSIDVPTKTLTIIRSKPTVHPGGEIVYEDQQFSLGIDSSNLAPGTDVLAGTVRAIDGNLQTPLPDPDSHGAINGIRCATWDTVPVYRLAKGEGKAALGVEMEIDSGSSAFDFLNAAGRSAQYQEKNFAGIGGVSNNVLQLQNPRYIRPLGAIHKILATVNHSGNRTGSALGIAPLSVNPNTGGFFYVGALVPTDMIDPDYLEIVERKSRRAVDVAVPPRNKTIIVKPDTIVVTGGGATNLNFDPAGTNPKENIIDGSFSSFGKLSTSFAGAGQAEVDISFAAVPTGADPTSAIIAIRPVIRHGGPGELSSGGQQLTMTLFRSAPTIVAGPTNFNANDTVQIDNSLSYNPGADTLANLTLYKLRIRFGTVATLGQWLAYEAFFEIDITEPDSTEDAGSVTNQFDITALMPSLDWEELKDLEMQIGGDGTNEFRVYHMGIMVIYYPKELKIPQTIACNLDSAFNQLGIEASAEIIQELWLGSDFAANPANTITDPLTIAGIASEQLSNGFSGGVAGLIRDKETFAFIVEIANQTRLFAFVVNSVLTLEFQALIADIPVPTLEITSEDVTEPPSFLGEDIERLIINIVQARYAFTDLGASKSIARQDATSVTKFREQLRKLEYSYLTTLNAVESAIEALFDRKAPGLVQFDVIVTLDLRNDLAPLTRFSMDIDWLGATKVEVIELSEGPDHKIVVRAIILEF